MPKKWIKEAGMKKGVLHKQLGIPEKKNIPMLLLNKIIAAKAGQTITNPTRTGNRRIKVTEQLEHRAVAARNLKNLRR